MRVYAFEGFRYDPGVGSGQELAAPPFDQIDDQLRDHLHRISPYQLAHLSRPVAGEAGDPHRQAAALHQRWLAEGAIRRDAGPSLYPYRILTPRAGARLGLCALIGLEPEGSDVIRPHERTLDKPFADRLGLLRAMKVDLEPVMFLADDPGTLEALLADDVAATPPVSEHHDADGNLHQLFRIADPARIARYREVLAPCSAAIADGHHRTKVARAYAEESGAAPGTAAAAKMAVLFSLSSANLVIDPIHRGLGFVPELSPCHARLVDRRGVQPANGAELAALVAAAPQPTLGLVWSDGHAELWRPDPVHLPAGSPPAADEMAVALLHLSLLPAAGFSPESYLDGTFVYRSDADKLFAEVRSGALALGFYLPPMSGETFGRAISKGDLLPAKATRFLPKVVSGLVWAGHDARLA